jgi:hypothetical protein
MLSNKVRNDSWWLLKCFDYLAGPLQMADQNRNNFLDFRRVIEERMTEYAREIESLEAKLKEEKEKAHRVSLEITEKPPVTTTQVVSTIQHANQFLEVLEPAPAPAPSRVTVTKEITMKAPTPVTSPLKPKVVPPADEPEEEDEPEEDEAEAEDEAEEVEEADDEEEEDEPEPEENYEQIRVKKTNYWLETISRKVYQITADGEVGDLVANYKLVNGVATLAPL